MMTHELQRAAVPSGFRPAMVECLRHCGIRDRRVLAAMAIVPRIAFMTDRCPDSVCAPPLLSLPHDQPVPGSYQIASLLEALRPEPWHRVLAIGTGSGYLAAVLSLLVQDVFAIEPSPERADAAYARLTALGYHGILVRCTDEAGGWPRFAPYDAILAGASAPTIPAALLEQLADAGRLVISVGDAGCQRPACVVKAGAVTSTSLAPVRFTPREDARSLLPSIRQP